MFNDASGRHFPSGILFCRRASIFIGAYISRGQCKNARHRELRIVYVSRGPVNGIADNLLKFLGGEGSCYCNPAQRKHKPDTILTILD